MSIIGSFPGCRSGETLNSSSKVVVAIGKPCPNQPSLAMACRDLSRGIHSLSPSIRVELSRAFAKAARSTFGFTARIAPASQNFRSASTPIAPGAGALAGTGWTCCRVGEGFATRDAGAVRAVAIGQRTHAPAGCESDVPSSLGGRSGRLEGLRVRCPLAAGRLA